VIAHRKGTFVHPVNVLVVREDGTRSLEKWDGQGRWQRFSYEERSPVVWATVDPETKWLTDGSLLNNGLSREAKRLPARRVSTTLAFWLQSLWQLLGF
jgi:hypothetical protein